LSEWKEYCRQRTGKNSSCTILNGAYAALNFAFVQAVMVPLGSEVEDESVLKWGFFWGGVGLGFML
jgi:uncharacterized membrane protein YkvI